MTIVHSKVDGGRNQGVDVADDNRGTTDGSQATDREPMNLSDTSGTGDLGEATAMGLSIHPRLRVLTQLHLYCQICG